MHHDPPGARWVGLGGWTVWVTHEVSQHVHPQWLEALAIGSLGPLPRVGSSQQIHVRGYGMTRFLSQGVWNPYNPLELCPR